MMYIGIVGAEAIKFTKEGERAARRVIRGLLESPKAIAVSGGCHLGGVDIWAEEEAEALGRKCLVFKPKYLNWKYGYKPRNLSIANTSDIVHCIVVDVLPKDFKGRRHKFCYHCGRDDHVKSGGCWTMKRAKLGQLHIVRNYPSKKEPVGA